MKRKGALVFFIVLVFLLVITLACAQDEAAAVEEEVLAPPFTFLQAKIVGISWYWWALVFLGLGALALYLQGSVGVAKKTASKHEKLAEIRGVILQQLGLKKPLSEIRSYLSLSGYDEALIKVAVARVEIYQYIVDHLKQRHTEEDIRDHLLSYGWSRSIIDPLILRAKNNVFIPPKKKPHSSLGEKFKSKNIGIIIE